MALPAELVSHCCLPIPQALAILLGLVSLNFTSQLPPFPESSVPFNTHLGILSFQLNVLAVLKKKFLSNENLQVGTGTIPDPLGHFETALFSMSPMFLILWLL